MAKNKSKKKQKKLAKQLGDRFSDGNIKNVGIALTSILIGALVEDAVQKLVRKTARGKIKVDSEGHNPIKSAVLTLQNHIEDSRSSVKDTVNTVSSIFNEVAPALTGITQQVTKESLDTIGNTTETASNNVMDTAKNFVGAIAGQSSKKDKKKGKKSKNKE